MEAVAELKERIDEHAQTAFALNYQIAGDPELCLCGIRKNLQGPGLARRGKFYKSAYRFSGPGTPR